MEADNRSLMELPKPNLGGVRVRLSLNSLLICCSSSITVLDTIENYSDLAKMDFEKSESQILIHFPKRSSFQLIDLDRDSPVEIKPSFNLYGYEVTHSCNGLLLLENTYTHSELHRCIVCNPVTGEYIILPESIARNVECAFFVSPTTHHFKVFRASHHVFRANSDSDRDSSMESDCSTELDIFSDSDVYTDDSSLSSNSDSESDFILYDSESDSSTDSDMSETDRMGELLVGGSDSWESVGDLPFSPFSIYSPCNLDQSTHWLCDDNYVANLIVFFNFETHEFGEILTPTAIGHAHMAAHDDMSLVVLGGCLSIFDGFTVKGEFHIWVMKEYGVWDSWSKDFVIDTTLEGLSFCYKPVMCRSNGEVVMICQNGFVLGYDLLKKSRRVLRYMPALGPFISVAYTPSIMSLRDAFRGSNVVVLNRESRFVQPDHNCFLLLGTHPA